MKNINLNKSHFGIILMILAISGFYLSYIFYQRPDKTSDFFTGLIVLIVALVSMLIGLIFWANKK